MGWVAPGSAGGHHRPELAHRYNTVLKRISGNKSRAQTTLAKLEAAAAWLERNRLAEHAHLLGDGPA